MISASRSLYIILENTKTLRRERVSLVKSLGRTLGQDIESGEDLPPFDNSSMDGFAIASSGLKQGSRKHPCVLKIVGESSAGKVFSRRIKSTQAVRVMTGGVIPGGADAVVP